MPHQRRLAERIQLSLPIKVQCRECGDLEWIETTQLVDVSPFGAKFTLLHPTEPGRLLHLTMRLPRNLRCYDKNEMDYKVWALVRHFRVLSEEEALAETGGQMFEIGAAFVGKEPPSSYKLDPTILYELRPVPAKDGQWIAREKPRRPFLSMNAGDMRQEPRLPLQFKVIIETPDKSGKVIEREETITENISHRGAALLTNLDIARGRFVRVISVDHNLAIVAVVRANRRTDDGRNRLHLEFVDKQWPL
jgi:hypothetical protein